MTIKYTNSTIEKQYINKQFNDCSFADCKFAGIVFIDCIFESVEFGTSDLRQVEFFNCQFGLCNWKNALINDTTVFYDCSIFGSWSIKDNLTTEARQGHIDRYNARLKNNPKTPSITIVKSPSACQYGSNDPVGTFVKTCCGGRKREIPLYHCSKLDKDIEKQQCFRCVDFATEAVCKHRGALVSKGDCDCGDGDVWECSILGKQIGKACGKAKCKSYHQTV